MLLRVFMWPVMLVVFLFCLPLNMVAAQSDEIIGTIIGNIPIKVEKDQPFEFDIWLDPHKRGYGGAVTIFMDNNPKVKYEPPKFAIKVGERQKVRATILRTDCGLAVIAAHASNWERLDTTVDAGFTAKLKTNINEPVESGNTKSFYLVLTDKDGNAVQLDTNTRLILQASKLQFYDQENKSWTESIEMYLKLGANSTPIVKILPNTWAADNGVIKAELWSSLNFPVYTQEFSISILPRWYLPLLMAIIGGVLYSITQLAKEFFRYKGPIFQFLRTKALPSLVLGSLTGALAYLFASWGILGIKVDTTSLQGFVIQGFLFSYVGLDLVLKAATQRKDAG